MSFVTRLIHLSSNDGLFRARFVVLMCSSDFSPRNDEVCEVSLTANPPPGRRDRSVWFDICRWLSRAQRVTEEERNHQTQLVRLESPPFSQAFSPPSVCQWPWPSPHSTKPEPILNTDRHIKALALVEQKQREMGKESILNTPLSFSLSLFSFCCKEEK